MHTHTKRLEQVAELILRETSAIIRREIDFREVIVTFSRVQTSKDLHYADVYFSVFPDEAAHTVLNEINKKIADIQRLLNKRLRMRPVPKIRFHIDEMEREAAKINELLKRI